MEEVHKTYYLGETQIEALCGIDLTIEKGEFVAVWGPSGSGKSTLCNLIGMVDSPNSGNILFQGQEIILLSDEERTELRNKSIGFIFQTFNLMPVLSALENVMLPLQIRGVPSKIVREKAMNILDELGIVDYIAHRPHKLSGGQQQRVAIARALITEPALVIADEPTANLDSDNARKIIDLMRKINSLKGTIFLFSTHDQRLLDRVHRQIQLEDGVIVDDKLREKS
ncbi:MAG: ABC transporter ATP-binding protein [Candidatus Omnitrophica bacterium]|nr:ABC transporter ATP-binding protein [Candidatus Omnitrophota bacterium]MBU0878546.1 ABC transporter ATP-binding protein [Candidatus Omnitrophota bacterium]MBU1134334.1 ABC transporter ATP-binding protein [Candidatus Omnitrophota bacterium]MBU1367590.1 ABC transporter ATP-binding protein [Candidatus Omnitrophota bacterium]MBU1524510.1 ABC transporter ATP-binding protein [Candidatus Omnitrophota bacterium]